jgi:hypothetical protein
MIAAISGTTIWGIAFWIGLIWVIVAVKRHNRANPPRIVTKVVKGDRAAERVIAQYAAKGYELQNPNVRKELLNVPGGLAAGFVVPFLAPFVAVGGRRMRYTLTFIRKDPA